jgi:hypothetical protein
LRAGQRMCGVVPALRQVASRYPALRSTWCHRSATSSAVHSLRKSVGSSNTSGSPQGPCYQRRAWVDEEIRAAVIRITGGNFRLLHGLITQIVRLVEINTLLQVMHQVVEAARESLVIGIA